MKKLLSIFIVIALICPVFLLTGCKKEEKRPLIEFYNNYLAIVEQHENLNKTAVPERFNTSSTIFKVGFKYSVELQQRMADSSSSYAYLDNYYNLMLDDAMAPTYLFAPTMFNINTDKISESEKTYIYKKLDQLESCYIETASRVGDVEKTLTNTATSHENLKKLFTSYEKLIQTACELSIKISDIYFNKTLINNLNLKSGEEKNLTNLATYAKTRFMYYKTLYLDIYVNTCLVNNDVPNKILNNTTNSPFDVVYYPYTSIKNINFTTQKTNLSSTADSILSLSQTLYNIEQVLDDEFNKYDSAISKINYHYVNNSNINENTQKLIVDKFINENGIVYESYNTITQLLDLCYEKIIY